ncbi:MAG: hypothetical protein JF615_02425 [Asticcacaulis sp.]|nr:hypothetical protein [Asticcacaulis sp.]
MTKSIVYDDDHIRVVFQDGVSDFLLVTFGDLYNRPNGLWFFGDGPATKQGMNALGFIAKDANWYPAASMQAAAAIVRDLMAPFTTVIAYGGSMGGYAAIKFSRLLGATCVVAYCPQWSIDPEDCHGRSAKYESLYRSYMTGMSVKSEDVSGRVFVFYDPADAVDVFHVEHLAQAHAELIPVYVHSADHHVTTILAGSVPLADIISACRNDDRPGVVRIVNRIRRRHYWRRDILLSRAVSRHPLAVLRALESQSVRSQPLTEILGGVITGLFSRFIAAEQTDLARRVVSSQFETATGLRRTILGDVLDRLGERRSEPQGWLQRSVGQIFRSPPKPPAIMPGQFVTFRGSLVWYSALENRLVHTSGELAAKRSDYVPVGRHPDEPEALGVPTSDGWACCAWIKGQLVLCGREDAVDSRFMVAPGASSAEFFLAGPGGIYLSATPDGKLALRSQPQRWETFRHATPVI